MSEEEDVDIVAVCKDILIALIDGKTPEEVQALLQAKGIGSEDAQSLMNVTIICTQEVTPVIEQRVAIDDALNNLVTQGLDPTMAKGITDMIIEVMGTNAAKNAGVDLNSPGEPVISQEEMTHIMRLAMAVHTDQQKNVPDSQIVEAIKNIKGIEEIKFVGGNIEGFVANVKLARQAMERTRAGISLPEVIKQLGIDKKEPYVAVLALFFLKAAVSKEG